MKTRKKYLAETAYLLSKGYSGQEIADMLGVTRNTIKNYRKFLRTLSEEEIYFLYIKGLQNQKHL